MDGLQNQHEQQQGQLQQQQLLGVQAVLEGDDNEEDYSGGSKSPAQARPVPDSERRNALREANRIHCKETRERKKKKEQLLREVGVSFDLVVLCVDVYVKV